MLSESFAIRPDQSRQRLVVQLAGFWSSETCAQFERDLLHLADGLTWNWGRHTVMIDLSEFLVQSREVFGRMERLIADDPTRPTRTALFGGSDLARMQFRRIVSGQDMRLFATRDEATRWLDQIASPNSAAVG